MCIVFIVNEQSLLNANLYIRIQKYSIFVENLVYFITSVLIQTKIFLIKYRNAEKL